VTASLELVAPPGCGSELELARAISARSARIHLESAETAERRLRIEIREAAGGVTTLLSLTQPNGRRSSRTLRASTCAEALDGAALVAAVSLDPTASTETVVEAPPTPPAPAPRAACPPCAPAPPTPAVEAAHAQWSALLAFDAISGPAPALMPGFGLTGMLEYERGSALSPAVRLSFSHFARGDFTAPGGTAEFSLDVASLELCPLRAQAGPLRVYPCLLRVSGGLLQASGSSTLEPAARERPWLELGASLLALLKPSRSLLVAVSAAAGRPVVRDRFQFEPVEFHRVSALALSLGVGAGVTFP
jgi:hypothetical protein